MISAAQYLNVLTLIFLLEFFSGRSYSLTWPVFAGMMLFLNLGNALFVMRHMTGQVDLEALTNRASFAVPTYLGVTLLLFFLSGIAAASMNWA